MCILKLILNVFFTFMRVHKVINADHIKVFLQQLDNTMRANIPGNENVSTISTDFITWLPTHPAPPVTSTVFPVPDMSGGVWIWKWITSAFSQQKFFHLLIYVYKCSLLQENISYWTDVTKNWSIKDWKLTRLLRFAKYRLFSFLWNPTPFWRVLFGHHTICCLFTVKTFIIIHLITAYST